VRRTLVPPLKVEWADAKGEGSCNSEVKSLHVSNFPDDTTEEDLKEAFLPHGAIERIALLDRKRDQGAEAGKKRDYAFVHYEKRSTMLKAFNVCFIVFFSFVACGFNMQLLAGFNASRRILHRSTLSSTYIGEVHEYQRSLLLFDD
jgi:hypothetical protein